MLKFYMGKAHKLLQQSLIMVLKGYRYAISPLLGPRCRFEPSCSHYAMEALTSFNVLKGIYLITRRLLRCHPFHPGGYDPLIHHRSNKHVR